MAAAADGGPDRSAAGSRLPFALLLGLCLFIGIDKSGLLGARSSVAQEPCAYEGWSPQHLAVEKIAVPEQNTSRQTFAIDALTSEATAVPEESSVHGGRRMSASGGVPRKQDSLLFLFNAIIVGTLITQLLTLPMFHGLQQTVVIFAVGVTYSLFLEGLGWNDKLGILGQSYDMWMKIDPHTLLFTMLPPLLAGDAMTMDTAIARRVSKQWLYLAGPGVLINGFLTAFFLYVYLPYDWPFLLCLVTGAILCATDPVAVVALLKELGAPPTLTVQIQGESLLNDGTAIVLYQLSFTMLEGQTYDVSSIIVFMVKTAACAWGLGLLVGWFFHLWITAASNKLEDHASGIQITLSLCCAYWSFIIAEGVFHISGVLATVAASLVLADKMWPVLVSKEAMHTVWEMLEFLGNIIVFFLAGALTGRLMVHMPFWDYCHLVVIYVVLVIIRASLMIASRPLMNWFGRRNSPAQYTTVADCLVMTWGGLRGAVGLALAIQVTVSRAGGKISTQDAERVLFYVGGVAALTLVINATTCPRLVKALGVTALPATKKRVLLMIEEQLISLMNARTEVWCPNTAAAENLKETLGSISSWIEEQKVKKDAEEAEDMNHRSSSRSKGSAGQQSKGESSEGVASVKQMSTTRTNTIRSTVRAVSDVVKRLTVNRLSDLRNYQEIIDILEQLKAKFLTIEPDHLRLLGDLPPMPSDEQESEVCAILASENFTDSNLVRAFNDVFLNLVNAQYWKLIEDGDVVPGTSEAEVLLSSIKLARGTTKVQMTDFQFVRSSIHQHVHRLSSSDSVTRFVDTASFNAFVMFAIVSNAIFIALEDGFQNKSNKAEIGWLVADMAFTAIFTVEFFFKFWELRLSYFRDSWNLFDFVLLILSIFSNVLGVMATDVAEGADVTGETRLVRLARVFRVMRLMRLFRLLQFLRVLKAKLMRLEFSTDVAKHVQTITVLTCFIKAHMHSQKEMLQYFGSDRKVDVAELAHCIIESQVQTYKAMSLAVDSVVQLDLGMLEEVNMQKKSKALAEQLDYLVHHAHNHGVLTSREAEAVLDPVRRHLLTMQARLREMHFGYIRGRACSDLDDAEKDETEDQDCLKDGLLPPSEDPPVLAEDGSIIIPVDAAKAGATDASLYSSIEPLNSTVPDFDETDPPVGAFSSSSTEPFCSPAQHDPNSVAIGKSGDDFDAAIIPVPKPRA